MKMFMPEVNLKIMDQLNPSSGSISRGLRAAESA